MIWPSSIAWTVTMMTWPLACRPNCWPSSIALPFRIAKREPAPPMTELSVKEAGVKTGAAATAVDSVASGLVQPIGQKGLRKFPSG